MSGLIASFKTDLAIKKALNRLHFVYFGDVRADDEHDVVRGKTASLQARDSHFAVGSYDEYEVRFVARAQQATTYIACFKIPATEAPVFTIEHSNSLATTPERHTQQVSFTAAPQDFTARYALHTKTESHILIEDIFQPYALQQIAAHAWPITFEYSAGYLYAYWSHPYSDHTIDHLLRAGKVVADIITT